MATSETDLAKLDDLSSGAVLRAVIDAVGGLDTFAQEIAHDFIDTQPGSNARARIGTTILQSLLKHGEDDDPMSDDLAELEATARSLMDGSESPEDPGENTAAEG